MDIKQEFLKELLILFNKYNAYIKLFDDAYISVGSDDIDFIYYIDSERIKEKIKES